MKILKLMINLIVLYLITYCTVLNASANDNVEIYEKFDNDIDKAHGVIHLQILK